MPKTYRLTGLPSGTTDVDKQELRFSLSISHGQSLSFVGKVGVVGQIISTLGRMLTGLRAQLDAQEGKMAVVAAEQVRAAHVQKERWHELVLLQLITPGGVPYLFAIPCRDAADIAARLKTESEKPTEVATA
jgi:hypothetical protein